MTIVVALAGASGLLLLVWGIPMRRRRSLFGRVEPYLSGLHGRPSSLLRAGSGRAETILEGPVGRALGKVMPATSDALRQRLASSGRDLSPGAFRLQQVTWGSACTLGCWFLIAGLASTGIGIQLPAVPLLTIAGFLAGFLGRDWWLGKEVERHRATLQEELPTAIDMVALSVMAGESVPAAFDRVSEMLGSGIGAEFRKVVADMRAGERAADALEALKDRSAVHGMSRFVDALVTGLERGTPLADVLAAQAEDGRELKRRYLMELGGRREVLMLVPVVFLIMPVVVLFALLPGLVSLNLIVP
jgi:tight adherence protein C